MLTDISNVIQTIYSVVATFVLFIGLVKKWRQGAEQRFCTPDVIFVTSAAQPAD